MIIDDEVNEKNSIIVIRKNSIIKKVLQYFEYRNSTKEDKIKEKEKNKVLVDSEEENEPNNNKETKKK